MYAIWRYGSEEQKQEWLPRMAAGEAIGCFGLTEPDGGSDPGSMRTRARRDGDDWVLDGNKMWITNGSVADVAVVWARRTATRAGSAASWCPPTPPGFTAPEIKRKMSLRASVTSELVLDGVRLPASAQLPGGQGLSGAAVVPERGPVRHRVRRARRGPGLPGDDDRLRAGAAALRQAARRRSS